jgi:hypothetical protein
MRNNCDKNGYQNFSFKQLTLEISNKQLMLLQKVVTQLPTLTNYFTTAITLANTIN